MKKNANVLPFKMGAQKNKFKVSRARDYEKRKTEEDGTMDEYRANGYVTLDEISTNGTTAGLSNHELSGFLNSDLRPIMERVAKERQASLADALDGR